MIEKYVAIETMSHEIFPLLKEETIRKVKQDVISSVSKLLPFHITPTGDVEIQETEYLDPDTAAVRAILKAEGRWLDFLHARRAGVFLRD